MLTGNALNVGQQVRNLSYICSFTNRAAETRLKRRRPSEELSSFFKLWQVNRTWAGGGQRPRRLSWRASHLKRKFIEMPTCAAKKKKKMAERRCPDVWEQQSRQLLDLWLVWATFDSEEELKQVLHQGKRKQCEKDRHVSAFTLSPASLLISYWAADGTSMELRLCVCFPGLFTVRSTGPQPSLGGAAERGYRCWSSWEAARMLGALEVPGMERRPTLPFVGDLQGWVHPPPPPFMQKSPTLMSHCWVSDRRFI